MSSYLRRSLAIHANLITQLRELERLRIRVLSAEARAASERPPSSTLQILPVQRKDGPMRLGQRFVVGLWMLVIGIAMAGWLAGLAWTTAWLIERITS